MADDPQCLCGSSDVGPRMDHLSGVQCEDPGQGTARR